LLWNGAAIALSLTQAKTGIPLLNLAGCIGGLFGLGNRAARRSSYLIPSLVTLGRSS
jgi:hypothetical protein